MKRLRTALLAAGHCALALGAGAAQFEARVVIAELIDDDTGKVVQGATFVAKEMKTISTLRFPGAHGGGGPDVVSCREVVKVPGGNAHTQLELPAVEIEPLKKLKAATSLHLYAHAPGYCIAQIGDTHSTGLWTISRDGRGELRSTRDPRTDRVTLRTRRDTGDPEQRIRYLRSATLRITPCTKGGELDLAPVRKAIESEIKALQASVPAVKHGRGFAIVPEGTNVRRIDWGVVNEVCVPGDRCFSVLGPKRNYLSPPPPPPTPPPGPLVIVCRNTANCDLDRRQTNGTTALYQYIRAADPVRVKLLLAAGADPNLTIYPNAPAGIDALFARDLFNPELVRNAAEVVQALAADGRATISPATARRLATVVKTGISPEVEALRVATEQAAALFPTRSESPAICQPVKYDPRDPDSSY